MQKCEVARVPGSLPSKYGLVDSMVEDNEHADIKSNGHNVPKCIFHLDTYEFAKSIKIYLGRKKLFKFFLISIFCCLQNLMKYG